MEQNPKFSNFLTEVKNPLKLYFGRSTRFFSFNEVCTSSRKLSSKKLMKYLGIFAKNLLIKFMGRQKPTHNRVHMSSKSGHWGESFEEEIYVRKSRSSHIPKLILAPSLHGLVPPGPEI